MVFYRDVDDIARFLECHAPPLFWIKPVHREPAKIAFCVADIGDGKLEIARPAVLKHFANEFEKTGPGPGNRLRKIIPDGLKGGRRFGSS